MRGKTFARAQVSWQSGTRCSCADTWNNTRCGMRNEGTRVRYSKIHLARLAASRDPHPSTHCHRSVRRRSSHNSNLLATHTRYQLCRVHQKHLRCMNPTGTGDVNVLPSLNFALEALMSLPQGNLSLLPALATYSHSDSLSSRYSLPVFVFNFLTNAFASSQETLSTGLRSFLN